MSRISVLEDTVYLQLDAVHVSETAGLIKNVILTGMWSDLV